MASSSPAVSRRLEGKVALITGGASGIGKRTAEIFAEQGAKVVIADIQDELGHSVAQSIGSSTCLYVHCDVTDENQIKNAVDTTVQTYGKLDIMFNNAGIGGPNNSRIIDNDKADFERVLSINLTGVFLGIKHAAQAMIPARTGSIISTSSISSYVGGAASHAYCCAKHAVVGLTKNAAVELGQFGIRVNCLSPYACATPLATQFVGLNDDMLESTMNLLANLKGVTFKTDDVANAALYFASDDSRLEGKVAIITGGASGIGAATAKLFVENGAKVIIADIQDELGQSLCNELATKNILYVHCDVTNESDIKNVVDTAVSNYGKLDIMFNNAGTSDDKNRTILDYDSEAFKRVFDVNVYGAFLGAKHAAKVMIPQKKGVILITASVATATAGESTHAYSASKHASVGLMKNLCVELGQYGIRVNCISPGAIPTPILTNALNMNKNEMEKVLSSVGVLKEAILEVEDIANAALYLSSDESKFVNGINIVLDGGYSTTNMSFTSALIKLLMNGTTNHIDQ